MSKIKGLYQNYLKEKTEDLQQFCTGGEKMNHLQDFLKQTLPEEDYLQAEELLNDLLAEVEEKGFKAGCKYISELNHELLSK